MYAQLVQEYNNRLHNYLLENMGLDRKYATEMYMS